VLEAGVHSLEAPAPDGAGAPFSPWDPPPAATPLSSVVDLGGDSTRRGLDWSVLLLNTTHDKGYT